MLKRVLLPIAVLVVSAVVAKMFMSGSARSERRAEQSESLFVETMPIKAAEMPARLVANGIVRSAQQVSVVPEVTGKLIYVSERLVPGGRLAKGELLARIDPRDYELGLRQEESRVQKAELDLRLEQGRQQTAAREWQLLGNGKPADEAPLALRKPQLEVAQVALAAAESGRERARLKLERTDLRAPFNALVAEEHVDVGQVVAPTTRAAILFGTDTFWVTVSVPVEKLPLIDIPGTNADQGSRAEVVQELPGGREVRRVGSVLRLAAQLDAQTRRAQVVVQVADPLHFEDGGVPLLPNAYVRVEIEGRRVAEVYEVPRTALQEGHYVWVVDQQGRLRQRQVVVQWSTEDSVFAKGELSDGLMLVTSPIALPIEGMKVRFQAAQAAVVPATTN